MTFSWESQNVSRRKCFVTEISRNVITHLDEILELLGDPDHEEPGGEVELGLGESPLTPGLPALGRHPAEERDLEMEEFYEVERVMLRKYQHRQRPNWQCANIAKLEEIAPSPESTFSWARSLGTGPRPHTRRRWWCRPPWPWPCSPGRHPRTWHCDDSYDDDDN